MARPKPQHRNPDPGQRTLASLSANERLERAVEAVHALQANAAVQPLNPRAAALQHVWGHGVDDKRKCSAWREYGWPENVTYDMMYWLYRREGIAFGAVNKLIGRCWAQQPEVIQGGKENRSKNLTGWEKANNPTLGAPWLWAGFEETDKRRLVGRYAGLLLHVADNRKWAQPVEKGGNKRLDKVTPAWANALTVAEWDEKEDSATYGQPLMWQYTEAKHGSFTGVTRQIHPDRIFILGEYKCDDIGFLEPVFNAFVSLEKVSGGSGESFLKNAARQIAVSYDKEINWKSVADQYGVTVADLQKKMQESARDLNVGNDVLMAVQGGTVQTLVAQVADPKPTFEVNLQIVSAGVDIPSKILVGNQTGERASTEDEAYFNARCQSRRDRSLAPEVLDFTRHLQRIGVVTASNKALSVSWGDLTIATPSERMANAKTMSEINAGNIGQEGPAFTTGEIRERAGYEPQLPAPATTPMTEEGEDDDEATA